MLEFKSDMTALSNVKLYRKMALFIMWKITRVGTAIFGTENWYKKDLSEYRNVNL